VLINRLLIACVCRYFEARQKPETPEYWHHLNPAVWPEVYRASTKACKQVLARNNSKTKDHNLVKITLSITYYHISLNLKNHYTVKMILIARRTGKTDWCLHELCVLLALVTSTYLAFLVRDFKSGFRCSCNGSPPLIWISSLYIWYQGYFVIIIVECLVTYLINTIWGWPVPSKYWCAKISLTNRKRNI